MADILSELETIIRLNGDTYSSAEVLAAVKRAAAEIRRLRRLTTPAAGGST